MPARVSCPAQAQGRRAGQILNQHPAQMARAEVGLLISTVERVVERIRAVADPELQRLSHQMAAALESAKAAIADNEAQPRDQAEELAEQGEIYVREHPWATLGVVALGMLTLGLCSCRAVIPELR